ncbi:MAG: hypothetical protein AAGD07_05380 [Planctomycetota bacterium]
MPKRRLPARPSSEFLKREAKELLSDYRREKSVAIADFGTYHPTGVTPREAKLSDAQSVLALSYRFTSWAKLLLATELCRAIHAGDAELVSRICGQHASLLYEPARGSDTGASWGTPYADARFLGDRKVYEYRDVTPLDWCRKFHSRGLVNEAAMRVIGSECDIDP